MDLLPSAVMRHSLQFLPSGKVHTLIGPLLFQKLATRFHSVALIQLGEWAAWAAFDHWVARQLPRLQPKVVVGYEMCCAGNIQGGEVDGYRLRAGRSGFSPLRCRTRFWRKTRLAPILGQANGCACASRSRLNSPTRSSACQRSQGARTSMPGSMGTASLSTRWAATSRSLRHPAHRRARARRSLSLWACRGIVKGFDLLIASPRKAAGSLSGRRTPCGWRCCDGWQDGAQQAYPSSWQVVARATQRAFRADGLSGFTIATGIVWHGGR